MRTRDHDAVLDGLRGFAAIAVMVFHVGHWLGIPTIACNAGLAVDFFFCLSGFVLSIVYRKRLDTGWGLLDFFCARCIRLMPMIVLATMLSAAYVALRFVTKHEFDGQSLVFAVGLGLANIPYLTAPHAVGGPQVFPLNGPQYSLFLEIVVNIFWGASLFLRGRLTSFVIIVVGIAGIALFGLGGDEASTFWSGLPRVFCSFYLGTLVSELRGSALDAGFYRLWPLGVVSMAALFFWPQPLSMPITLLWIAFIAPLIVLGSTSVRLPARARQIGLLLGRLSFPIYALHYPLFCWINGLVQAQVEQQVAAIEIPIFLTSVPFISWLLLISYDEPLRDAILSRGRVPIDSRSKASDQRGY